MMRWWDYIVVFLYADVMTAFLIMGFSANEWFVSIIAGLMVGFLWTSWRDVYCQWRLHFEESQR